MSFNPALLFEVGADTTQFEGSMSKILSTVKGTVAGFVGFGSVAAALNKAFQEAVKTETALSKLKLAVSNSRDGSDKLYVAMSALASKMGTLGRFSADEATQGLATLTEITKSSKVAMEALPAVMEMATQKNMDLSQAARLVGRAYESGTGILRRFGVQTATNVKGQEALNAIMKQFGGAIKEDMTTTAGMIKNVKNSFDELMGTLGKLMLPIIKDIITEIKGAIEYWQVFADKIGGSTTKLTAAQKEHVNSVNELSKAYEKIVTYIDQYNMYGESDRNPFDPFGKGLSPEAYVKFLNDQSKAAFKAVVEAKKLLAESMNPVSPIQAKDPVQQRKEEAEEKASIAKEAADKEAAEMKKGAEAQAAFEKQQGEVHLATLQNVLSQTSGLMSSSNREQFELGKAAATANAGISSAVGAIQAYTSLSSIPVVGPALGIAAAAALSAFGAVQMANIANTQFNPGGAANGVFDFRSSGNNETLTTTLRKGESIIPESMTDAMKRGKIGGSSGDTYNITIQNDGITDTAAIDRTIKNVLVPGLVRLQLAKGTVTL